MTRRGCRGFTLIELLVAIGLAGLISLIVLPAVLSMQATGLAEVSRNDLHQRAERLLRFLGDELRSTAFQVGAAPRRPGGVAPVLIQDSRPGNPAVTLDHALVAVDGGADGDDALTLVKGESFFPPLLTVTPAPVGATSLRLNRRPNQSPGSSREILPAPEALSHILLTNQRGCYPVAGSAQTLQILDPLGVAVPAGSELLGLRAHRFYLQPAGGLGRLCFDNFTSDEILDDAVDGLQFEYLLANGQLVDSPAQPGAVRAIRVSLLVRDLRPDRDYLDVASYDLGNRRYGPYRDRFRRLAVSEMVEVPNHGLP